MSRQPPKMQATVSCGAMRRGGWRAKPCAISSSRSAASWTVTQVVRVSNFFTYRDGNVPDYVLIEKPGPQTWRRSVYRYNIRTFGAPLMTAFDCPDPSVSTPSRSSSTTPLQALSLLNNHFVIEQSQFIAGRIGARGGGVEASEQVGAAYQLVLLRDPTDAERERAVRFVRQHGLAGLCRVLVNSNEFLYVF